VDSSVTFGSARSVSTTFFFFLYFENIEHDGKDTTVISLFFACVTLDWWPATKCDFDHCTWDHHSALWDVDLEELRPYAQAMAPFVLRMGGSLQDYVVGEMQRDDGDCNMTQNFPVNESMPQGFGLGCITMQRLYDIISWCRDVGCQIIWGLNGLEGRNPDGTGPWNSTSTEQILQFLYHHQAPLWAVTLGNEIWAIKMNLTASQALDTFQELNNIITRIWKSGDNRKNDDASPGRPLIAGFDGNGWSLPFDFYKNVLPQMKTTGVRLDILNYHDYPLGSSNVWPDVIDNALDYNMYESALTLAQQAHATAHLYDDDDNNDNNNNNHEEGTAKSPFVMVSESGGSYDSGSLAATGSFASGFWYLANLAATHAAGNVHFCRQALTGGSYELLRSHIRQGSSSEERQKRLRRPAPDYWNTVLYNRLMGQPLINLTKSAHGTRWLIHCSKRHPSGLSVLALNYNRTHAQSIRVVQSKDDQPRNVIVYHLTPLSGQNATQAFITELNGTPLIVHADEDHRAILPSLEGKLVKTKRLTVAPLTYAFFELFDVNYSDICATRPVTAVG